MVFKHSLHGGGCVRATLKSKSLSVQRRVLVSLMVIYPKNVKPQERGQIRSLILRDLFEEESEVL
jgi:hypothetical protein